MPLTNDRHTNPVVLLLLSLPVYLEHTLLTRRTRHLTEPKTTTNQCL